MMSNSRSTFSASARLIRVVRRRQRCDVELVKTDHGGLGDVERLVIGMSRNRHEQLAVLEVFVAQTMIFRAEDQRDFTVLCAATTWARLLAAFGCAAIESGSARGANDERAVGDRFPDSLVALALREDFAAVHGHRPRPKAPGARFADDGELAGVDMFFIARATEPMLPEPRG